MMILLSTAVAQGQIKIGGNVYGGGNHAEVQGSTKVTVNAGDIGAVMAPNAERPLKDPHGKVFGGARMANVRGNSFVHIDGEHATDYILINQVFGGNDIAGQIGTAAAVGEEAIPAELTNGTANGVDNTFNSYVRISTKMDGENPATDAKKIYIGQLFAGGNGDYTYTDAAGNPLKDGDDYIVKQGDDVVASSSTPFVRPEQDKTYLEIKGGSIVYGYGGGNNVTVKEQAIIHIDNPSEVVNHIWTDNTGKEVAENTEGATDLLTEARFKEMGINTTFSKPSSGEYQVGRFFGGNNKAEMAIRPTWNLLSGKVRNLYSGGNQGSMTSPEGLLLEIPTYSTLEVDNLYGGCRMSDVKPTVNGEYVPCTNLAGYSFPNELSARVLVRGGHINNVYGGNDVTGSVYGGNAVGIYTTVYGDVYGGGNGSYPYTDAENMEGDETYGDFFYETGEMTSVEALNDFRPNAEQVSIRLKGTDAKHPTTILGSVYLGGNCATLKAKKKNPRVELKMGSHVIADKVFLGNNGEGMIDREYLEKYADTGFSTLTLTNPTDFSDYMEGVTMSLKPDIVFDDTANGDPDNYEASSSYVGSFYCGGNVGGMAIPGKMSFTVDKKLNIFNKFVGGCNNANVAAVEGLNAAYEGGVLGSKDERGSYTDNSGNIKDRIEINLDNLTITPLRWNDENNKTYLVWNKQVWDGDLGDFKTDITGAASENIRVLGGNVYGGCYESGHVNGNVVININEDVLDKQAVFGTGTINGRSGAGIDLASQRDDLMAVALAVFGAGYGKNTEIWGSTTVNHNNGYVFQIFGGGERGVVGKKTDVLDEHGQVADYVYEYNPAYSSTVNLNGIAAASSNEGSVANLAEAEYIYGGGNEGNISGNVTVNLGNGRIYDAFGGASDADILGHTEVYIGRQPNSSGGYKDGFPWIKDIVYGGNDFGGKIHGAYEDGYNFEARLRDYDTDKTQLHGYQAGEIPDVLKSSTYVEYLQGRVDSIFGGGYGYYDYTDTALYGEGVSMPEQHSSFVNIRPKENGNNQIKSVFGGGTGHPGNRQDDGAQDCSYVLIDIPDGMTNFTDMEVFGAGSFNGLGMGYTKEETFADGFKLDEASAIIDLLRGRIHNAYGGSYQEGVTRRTVVNVPEASSIQIDNIFGGAYGKLILPPCDVYETQVNYKNTSENAQVFGAIYGGNNNERRSLFTQVNISSPVYSNKEKKYTGTVYGAGRGIDTWSEHTEVNLLKGARVYNVFGGGEMGHVLNSASVQAYQNLYKNGPSPQIGAQDAYWSEHLSDLTSTADGVAAAAKERWQTEWKDTWKMGSYYDPNGAWTDYAGNGATNLNRFSDRPEIDDATARQLDGQKKHNTNVIVNEGAVVEGYAYGGGLGDPSVPLSGDVYGNTYIAVLGGEVLKDVYAGGRTGGLDNLFGADDFDDPGNTFTATANAYIMGGTARNVYGGGYEGHVGHHSGDISESYAGDRPAESYVVIGKLGTNTFVGGAPAITRNVYGGGEGGSVYGTSHVAINNGYIGYRYKTNGANGTYVKELDDQTPNAIEMAGNVFGGGYVINSYVDTTNVNLYGGIIRGSVYGGGEVGPIGRGYIKSGSYTIGEQNGDAHIFHAGQTNVNMYSGHVLRNVFGGGRGKDSWGGDGTLYMDPALVATLDMKAKGFVFGQTRVNIYGGEIGTDEGMARGFGNVFGGCDEGSLYSAYMKNNTLCIGKKIGERYKDEKEGYYYEYENDTQKTTLTEDCKVVVAPHARALGGVSINGHSYTTGNYVPIEDLNTLKSKNDDTRWQYLDPTGIIIHNAVFAGGNLAPGSTSLFANAKTVYGNATASIHDVYNRDLITIGTGHTGGLYGDGNLTFVDGYRELNITNYGTDYHHISKQLTYDQYKVLPVREQAYYELKYSVKEGKGPITDNYKNTYADKASLPQDEILLLFADTQYLTADGKKPNPDYWQEEGVVSVYAGRIMNTIQRADFCGVFGSRMVMKGAPDRVPEEVDYTNYTINRVREVSLNKKDTKAGDTGDNATHGNYFGIYSVVNYLGALTSDVKFGDIRKTNSSDPNVAADGTTTYYQWKSDNITNKKRNNGTCHNHLALASGVYLEITTEESTGNTLDTKDWGPITGVVELDLINVQPGIGGGFVYAKNEHGEPTGPNGSINTLTALNTGAATKGQYTYATLDNSRHEWETTGNFIHSSQTIIDDCYNVSNRYLSSNFVKAHYWYIAGSVYVYDQYISAYTGSPNAYSETVEIPITINAAANGTMTLHDVQPNLYAYYSTSANTPLEGEQKLVIGDVTYQKNSPISYWDWSKLPAAEKQLFVKDTYVNTQAYKTSAESTDTIAAHSQVELNVPGGELYSIAEDKMVPASQIFHSSNNMSHTTGYLLTYNVDNPKVWDKWYTPVSGGAKNQTGGDGYEDGPTYQPAATGVYGQKEYEVNAIISKQSYDDYNAITNKPTSNQATFVPAYLVTKEYTSETLHYYSGAPVSTAISGYTAPAFVSTATIQLSPSEFIYVNDLMTEEQKEKYKEKYPSLATDIDNLVKPAYICTAKGLYGGNYYEVGKNYRALEAYSAMSPTDRGNFQFNYDALDLLIDPTYGGTSGQKYQYDSKAATLAGAQANTAGYSMTQSIDYKATYTGATDETAHNEIKLINGQEYDREDYEKLPNEQRHYAPISVSASGTETTVYVIKESFVHGETPYAVGTTISSDAYNGLTETEQSNYITKLTFPSDGSDKTYYYCREEYQVDEKTDGVKPTIAMDITGASGGIVTRDGKDWVTVGTIINAATDGTDYGYASLPNYQKNFIIHGVSPMETSTLYVARDADINELSTEKIITVIYRYDYEESDADGMHITPVTERHVVNIHIKFKSGVPDVEDINPPTTVLPGTGITMRIPSVTPGAYEVTGGGWELFEGKSNAESHTNGIPYTPSEDPLYWYQDGFYLAYYAKTYLGKTYSNHVPVSVANYHDLKRIMDDKENHLHVDYDRSRLKRDSKIYINDYSGSSENGLDLFKDFYDLSLLTSESTGVTDDVVTTAGRLKDHHILNQVNGPKAGENLEFFLRTDIDHPDSWTTIGTDDQCFKGNFHGDGHTISGLNNSLFYNLCGSVYNLGVTGTFNSAGVADKGTGYVESAWVKTENNIPLGSKPYAVFGNPADDKGYQIVNSYFYDGNKDLYNTSTSDGITTSGGARGKARAMTAQEFYNGTVAYNLNNFYLYKRYSDQKVTSGAENQKYSYFTVGNDGKLALQNNHYYTSHADLCSTGYEDNHSNVMMYVEDRYADGDFRYAGGTIPEQEDERFYTWITNQGTDNETVESAFFPIWPDDYIFFGQKLTYGWATEAHQNVPTAVVREGGRLSTNLDANRVYRAPAYYRSKEMGVAHFNPHAYLAQTQKDVPATKAYPNMTAIDFKGHYEANAAYGTYGLGNETGLFYTPLLDDDGLLSIQNCDETRNMLAYAPTAGANAKTYGVLNSYFAEPAYADYYDNTKGYRLVTEAPSASIHGHLVQSNKAATNDHLLVDKQDFNAPIAYTFDADHLMWYQRTPDDNEYVDTEQGWQGISIPFTAELVTTDTKGEITHFYSGSSESDNGTGTKKGHEYWLRELGTTMTEKSSGVLQANFHYPNAASGSKTVANSFLWDYYYKNENLHNQLDANADTYLQYRQYYKESRSYAGYPLLQAAKPYIVGFPGKTYYEFDLSGKWEAQNTAVAIGKLGKQILTFASNKGIGIGISDKEMAGEVVKYNNTNYTFRPSYMNETLTSGDYVLNSTGNAYEAHNSHDTHGACEPCVSAFRPFFTVSASSSAPKRQQAKQIVFGGANGSLDDGPESTLNGELEIYVKDHKIVTTSHLKEATTISIFNVAGISLANYVLKAGETIETPVHVAGVYIVNKKKVFVR